VAQQALVLEMQLKTMARQANQLLEKTNTTVRSTQERVVTTMATDAGRTTAVKVRYLEAATENIRGGSSTNNESGKVPQSNEGKSYICRRETGDDGRLTVTYEDGTAPPSDECEIVSQNMEMVGRPNPLAQYFADRTISLGETITLPRDVADQVFNLGEQFGKVTQFDLKLTKLQTEKGKPYAHFRARVEAASSGASQMRLQVEGPIVLETDTCRASQIVLAGPIGMSETRGSYSTSYQVMATGRMNMSVTSGYTDASR
jgi:hypothetical protein